jgi:hypothetical protein
MNADRLMSGREAAKTLGMSLAWLHQSDVPYVKLGRRRLYRMNDLRRFINSRIQG